MAVASTMNSNDQFFFFQSFNLDDLNFHDLDLSFEICQLASKSMDTSLTKRLVQMIMVSLNHLYYSYWPSGPCFCIDFPTFGLDTT